MRTSLTTSFLLLGALFAAVHWFAVSASLYWYYWWFDVMMHFWGGILIGLGVHTLATFRCWSVRPSLSVVLLTLLIITVSWEVFERAAGLYNPLAYVVDTAQDLALGFAGGLLAHVLLRQYTMKQS